MILDVFKRQTPKLASVDVLVLKLAHASQGQERSAVLKQLGQKVVSEGHGAVEAQLQFLCTRLADVVEQAQRLSQQFRRTHPLSQKIDRVCEQYLPPLIKKWHLNRLPEAALNVEISKLLALLDTVQGLLEVELQASAPRSGEDLKMLLKSKTLVK